MHVCLHVCVCVGNFDLSRSTAEYLTLVVQVQHKPERSVKA